MRGEERRVKGGEVDFAVSLVTPYSSILMYTPPQKMEVAHVFPIPGIWPDRSGTQ